MWIWKIIKPTPLDKQLIDIHTNTLFKILKEIKFWTANNVKLNMVAAVIDIVSSIDSGSARSRTKEIEIENNNVNIKSIK